MPTSEAAAIGATPSIERNVSPGTPMLFQGQEFGATSPFFYFADHKPELGCKVEEIYNARKRRNRAMDEVVAAIRAGKDDDDEEKT